MPDITFVGMTNIPVIRDILPSETGILKTMLYNAIYVPHGREKLPYGIIEEPEIAVYIENFGREGDICLVADTGGVIAGATWTRLFTAEAKGYGFISPEIPELSMSVLEQYRRQGIGTMLLAGMLKKLASKGFRQVSLSVDLANYAYRMYRKQGCEDYARHDESMTMLRQLKP